MDASLSLHKPSWTMAALAPRQSVTLVALLCTGLALGYVLSQEPPLGRVQGRVVIGDTERPLARAHVVLTADVPDDEENESDTVNVQRRFRAVTDSDGNFSILKIPAGFYIATAYTRAHSVDRQSVFVGDGGVSNATLYLKRSQPELQLALQQRVFLGSETVSLPVHGYVDGEQPSGKDTLHMRVFRTRLSQVLRNEQTARALQSVGQTWNPPPSLPNTLLHPAAGAAPQLVSERDMPVTEADQEGFFHKRITLPAHGPGLYLAEVKHHGKTVCAWVQVTDTAVVTKRARHQLLAYLVDMKTGVPRPGQPVQIYHDGRLVAQTPTDTKGLASFNLPATTSSSKLMTVALCGQDEGVVSQYDYEGENNGNFTVHTYTDRPVYRPGQRIYYKGIARRIVEEGSRYAVPVAEPVAVELRDPSGERILKESTTANRYGAFHGWVELSAEAPTGAYEMITTLRGERHTQDISVASYRKPEYEVTVAPGEKRYTMGDEGEMFVNAQFYFGAPVAGAKVQYEVLRAPDWQSEYAASYRASEDAADDTDEDNSGEGEAGAYSSGEMVSEGHATLDANGHAIIHFSTDEDQGTDENRRHGYEGEGDSGTAQAQMYSVHVTVKDAGGREITSEGSVRVTAGDFHLSVIPEGYVATPGQPTHIQLVAKDYDGHPVPKLPLDLESGFQHWNATKAKTEFKQIGVRRTVTGADGKATISLTPPQSGELVIKASARDARRHQIEAQTDLWVSGRDGAEMDTDYNDLTLLTDKRNYRPGDTARVLINARSAGQTILLAVEGSKIYRAFTVPARRRSTMVEVPVLAGYGPNVFLSACYVKDKKFERSETPLRVTVAARQVTVKIQPDKWKHQPGDKITYAVQTLDNKGRPVPCEFSFGVVDEAIYAIRPDTPNALRNQFYPHRSNSVNTGYSFSVEYLGDADKGATKIVARKRFPDTAYWQPCLQTDGNGRATVSFSLPDNLTTWRATAVAQTLDSAFGRQTNKIVTAKDFFVRLEAPRFLTQGDQTRLMAFVHNETGAPQTASVRLEAEGLAVNASAMQTISLQPGAVGQAVWPISTDLVGLDLKGTARLHVTAWTDKNGGSSQYTDGVDSVLPVRPHGREDIAAYAGQLTAAKPVQQVLTIAPSAIPGVNKLTLHLSPSITSAVVGALDYLIGFPYGCTEQTMSRFLPDILVQRLLRLNGTKNPQLSAQLPKMVRDGLSRLYRFQHEKGDWGWWENDEPDPWMTGYVLYGLTIAKQEGYPVSEKVLDRAREAAATMAKGDPSKNRTWNYSWQERPFLLYALAVAGDTDTPRAVRKQIQLAGLGPEALAYMVLLDKTLGGTGEPALTALQGHLVTDDSGLSHFRTFSGALGSDWDDITATAAGLQAILATDPSDPRVNSVLLWLMTHRTGEYWQSTRDTSWVMIALSDYLKTVPQARDQSGAIQVHLNDKLIQTYELTPDTLNERELVLHVPAASLRTGKNRLKLERVGGGSPVFYSAQLRQTTAMDTIPALPASGITIAREFLRVLPRQVGQDSWTLQTEPTNNRLQQGDQVRVRLTLDVPRDLSYVLIEDAFPSGCEVTERGDAESNSEDWTYWWSKTDVRDDRIAFFATRMPKGRHVIEYNLRAQTPGRCRALPTMLQAMYNPSTRAESAETQLEVQ